MSSNYKICPKLSPKNILVNRTMVCGPAHPWCGGKCGGAASKNKLKEMYFIQLDFWFDTSPVHQFIRLANWNRRDLVSYRKADPALVPSFEARLRPISDFAGANSSRCETAARISIAEQFPGYSIEVRGGNQAAIQAHRVSLESPSKSLENLGFSKFILVRDKPLKSRIWRRRRDSNPRYRIISTTV
jgi:hypothetical protein